MGSCNPWKGQADEVQVKASRTALWKRNFCSSKLVLFPPRASISTHTEKLRRYVKKFNSVLTPHCYRVFCFLPFSGKRYNMYTQWAVPNFLTYSDSSKKQQQIRTSERVYINIYIYILSVYTSKIYKLLLIDDVRIANHHCWPSSEAANLTKYG